MPSSSGSVPSGAAITSDPVTTLSATYPSASASTISLS